MLIINFDVNISYIIYPVTKMGCKTIQIDQQSRVYTSFYLVGSTRGQKIKKPY